MNNTQLLVSSMSFAIKELKNNLSFWMKFYVQQWLRYIAWVFVLSFVCLGTAAMLVQLLILFAQGTFFGYVVSAPNTSQIYHFMALCSGVVLLAATGILAGRTLKTSVIELVQIFATLIAVPLKAAKENAQGLHMQLWVLVKTLLVTSLLVGIVQSAFKVLVSFIFARLFAPESLLQTELMLQVVYLSLSCVVLCRFGYAFYYVLDGTTSVKQSLKESFALSSKAIGALFFINFFFTNSFVMIVPWVIYFSPNFTLVSTSCGTLVACMSVLSWYLVMMLALMLVAIVGNLVVARSYVLLKKD
jgi:hypothetical protein